MANTFKATGLVARGIVDQFKYEAPFTMSVKNVNKFIGASFDGQVAKSGRSIDVKLPVRYRTTGLGSTDTTFDEQAIFEEYTPFSLTSFGKAHVAVNLPEGSDYLDSLVEDVIEPSKLSIVDNKEAEHSQVISKVGNAVLAGSLGADIDDAGKVRSILRQYGTPMNDIMFLAGSDIQDSIVNNTSNFFNPSEEIKYGWYEGEVRKAKEMKWASSELLPVHTNGTAETSAITGTDYSLLGVVATSGSVTALASGSTISISGVGTDGTVTAGTVIEVAGVNGINSTTYTNIGFRKQFAVAADATVSGGAVTLTLTDKMNDGSVSDSASVANVTALPAAGAAVYFLGEAGASYKQAIGYHKDAFMVGYSNMADPEGTKFDRFESFSGKTGIKGMTIYDYDFNSGRNVYRTDCFSGVALLRREWACRLLQKIS